MITPTTNRTIANKVSPLQLAQVADYCVRWLKSQGIKVKRVEGDNQQPRIIVKHNALCERLEGITLAYERSQYGERRFGWVFRFGCQIKWAVPAQNPHNSGRAA